MAVEDHPVHPSTIHNDMRYTACQQKVRKGGYYVVTRKYWPSMNGRYNFIAAWVEDTSSTGCRYMDFETDAGCRGCPQPKDMEYIDRMKGLE